MKKFLAICLVLVTVLAIALPSMVLADTQVNGKILPQPSVTHVYMRGTSNAAEAAMADNTSTPSVDVDIIGTNFDVTDGVAPNDPMPTVTTSGAAAIVVSAVSVVDANTIHATFAIVAATTSGDYDVFVHQGGKMSNQGAADYFIVGSYVNITAPTLYIGVMNINATTTANTTQTGNSAGSISTNDTSNTVSAINSASTHPGYMDTVGDGSGTRLANKFNISPDSNPSHLVTADNSISYSVGRPSTALPLYVSQQVVTETAGTYKITITYTCSGLY
jgi:hypothetical protein